MSKRIFVWVAHPRAASFCSGLADAYVAGAEARGADVRRLDLSAMRFDPHFEGYSRSMPPLEPDLEAWQAGIAWAEHVFVVHPYWWGAMPAGAKAVLDRALLPGFGFKYHKGGLGWDKLLTGRTADVIVTSDTPPLIDWLLYGRPARRVMKNQVLGFCGIRTRTVTQLGPIKTATEAKRTKWLQKAHTLGTRAAA